MMKQIAAVALAAALAACARPYAPSGGDPDRLPPALVSTEPGPLAVIDQLNEPVVFTFGERLRTRTFNRSLISVSPGAPEDIEFDVRRNQVRIRRRGGWLPNQIYQVTLRPGIEDLFNNRRTEAAELVFSTGPQIPPSALAGLVEDRLTGRAGRDVVVEAIRRNDSTVYRAYGDSSAFFALRYIPYGTYDVLAYSDANRNSRRDPSEARHLGVTASIGPGQDTVQVFFELLPSDTTPPRVLRAETTDSVTVRISFDDAIDADSGLVAARAELFVLPDSSALPAPVALQLEAAATAAARARRAAADSVAATDSVAAADSAAVRPPPRLPAAARQTQPQEPTRPLPEKTAVLTAAAALLPGEYAVVVQGARNVNGLTGGGTARFTVRPRAAPPTPPADTTAVARPDTVPETRLPRR